MKQYSAGLLLRLETIITVTNANIFDTETRNYTKSDTRILNITDHARQRTNHFYVNAKRKEIPKEHVQQIESQQSYHQSNKFSESHEYSLKFLRMSHQVTYQPAAISQVERPLSLKEFDEIKADIIMEYIPEKLYETIRNHARA
eukprot:137991_1